MTASPNNDELKTEIISDKIQWRFFLRQIFICSGVWIHCFNFGLCLGAPAVYIPQIIKDNTSSIIITEETSPWLTAVYGYAGAPWLIILNICIRVHGRKMSMLLISVISLSGCIIFYFSSQFYHLIISGILNGIINASAMTLLLFVLSEYTSPKYRGMFLTLKAAIFFWGIWVSNSIGTFAHWRYIGTVSIVFAVYNLICVFFWRESPYWLASKGRLDECSEAHYWLKGTSKDSKEELKGLIDAQIQSAVSNSQCKLTLTKHFLEFIKMIKTPEFYKPVALGILSLSLYHCSGKFVCSVYSLQILKKMTNNEKTAYTGMLILDGITVIGMYTGCFISKFVGRKILLTVSTVTGFAFLLLLSIYLYLVKLEIFSDNSYISVSLLIVYSLGMSCGPLILSSSICAELLPIKGRIPAGMIFGLYATTFLGFTLKITLMLIRVFNLHGTFLCFFISGMACLIVLLKCMPETKDKTLKEISSIFEEKKLLDCQSIDT